MKVLSSLDFAAKYRARKIQELEVLVASLFEQEKATLSNCRNAIKACDRKEQSILMRRYLALLRQRKNAQAKLRGISV